MSFSTLSSRVRVRERPSVWDTNRQCTRAPVARARAKAISAARRDWGEPLTGTRMRLLRVSGAGLAAIGKDDQRAVKAGRELGDLGRKAAIGFHAGVQRHEHQVIALARLVLHHIGRRIQRHPRRQMHFFRIGFGVVGDHLGGAFLGAGLDLPGQGIGLQVRAAFLARLGADDLLVFGILGDILFGMACRAFPGLFALPLRRSPSAS